MNNIRAKFEEIWPVPDDVYWCSSFGGYWHATRDEEPCRRCEEHDLRLDTFTRCQETADVYVSLVDELVGQLRDAKAWVKWEEQLDTIQAALHRAKQIIGAKQ